MACLMADNGSKARQGTSGSFKQGKKDLQIDWDPEEYMNTTDSKVIDIINSHMSCILEWPP